MDLNQHSTAKLMQDNSISYEAFRRENNSLCLKLILSPLTPNCYIAPINIPEPTPHLYLFLLASELIPPYESLRIRPPPEPPPQALPRPSRPLLRHSSYQITSFFKRSSRTSLPPPS